MSQLLDLAIKSRIEASKRRVVQDQDLCCTSAPTIQYYCFFNNPRSKAIFCSSPPVRKLVHIPS